MLTLTEIPTAVIAMSFTGEVRAAHHGTAERVFGSMLQIGHRSPSPKVKILDGRSANSAARTT
jgi:hypothetical protein